MSCFSQTSPVALPPSKLVVKEAYVPSSPLVNLLYCDFFNWFNCRSKNIHKYFCLEAPERVLFALFAYRPRTKTGILFNPLKMIHFLCFSCHPSKISCRKYNLRGFCKLGNTLEFLCYLVIIELPNYCFITTYSCIMSLYR